MGSHKNKTHPTIILGLSTIISLSLLGIKEQLGVQVVLNLNINL